MSQSGISPRVLTEVARLNRRYLQLARRDGAMRDEIRQHLDDCQWTYLLSADAATLQRIADVPYLLFDLTAVDPLQEVGARQPRLGASLAASDLILLALGFAHQLNLRNRFCVRIIAGADTLWCEALASLPFEALADLVVALRAPLTPALADSPRYWNTLLRAIGNDCDEEIQAIKALGFQHSIQKISTDGGGHRLAAARRRSVTARLSG